MGSPQFHAPLSSTLPSVQHKRATPFQPPKSLSSTPKTPQFNTPLSSKPKTLRSAQSSVQHQKPFSSSY